MKGRGVIAQPHKDVPDNLHVHTKVLGPKENLSLVDRMK
jgi:hypothetical protein